MPVVQDVIPATEYSIGVAGCLAGRASEIMAATVTLVA